MKTEYGLLHGWICLPLILGILFLSPPRHLWAMEAGVQSQQGQETSATVVPLPLTEEEIAMFGESGETDQVTAGHRRVPVRTEMHASDVLRWTGLLLICLGLAIYPY